MEREASAMMGKVRVVWERSLMSFTQLEWLVRSLALCCVTWCQFQGSFGWCMGVSVVYQPDHLYASSLELIF